MSKSKSKSKGKKSKRPTVRGPQLGLKLGKSKGEPARTARMRFVEPPAKKDGNPFFAFRVPGGLLRAFKAHAKKKGTSATSLARAYMSKVTGIELDGDNDE